MKFLENDLEEIIYTSGMDVLEERGLLINGKLKRQVKIGNYGVADLISFRRPFYYWRKSNVEKDFACGIITIYELKKDTIGISAFLQALGYAKGIKEYLKKRGKEKNYIINIVLIGKNIDMTGSVCYIPELCNLNSPDITEPGYIAFYTYKYKVDGISFEEQELFSLTRPGF